MAQVGNLIVNGVAKLLNGLNVTGSVSTGSSTTTSRNDQLVCGSFNYNRDDSLFIVGNGTDSNAKSNAISVQDNGDLTVSNNIWLASDNGSNTFDTIHGIVARWKDNSDHQLISIQNGLTSGIGWAGSSSYPTVTLIRGQSCRLNSSSGTVITSDERLKKDFQSLDKWDGFYNELEPCAFKMKAGASGRYHIGFKAQQVEDALINNDLTTKDFGGIIKDAYKCDKEDEDNIRVHDEAGIKEGDTEYGIIYTEFVAMNTYQIQKLKKENEELKKQNKQILERLEKLESEIHK